MFFNLSSCCRVLSRGFYSGTTQHMAKHVNQKHRSTRNDDDDKNILHFIIHQCYHQWSINAIINDSSMIIKILAEQIITTLPITTHYTDRPWSLWITTSKSTEVLKSQLKRQVRYTCSGGALSDPMDACVAALYGPLCDPNLHRCKMNQDSLTIQF